MEGLFWIRKRLTKLRLANTVCALRGLWARRAKQKNFAPQGVQGEILHSAFLCNLRYVTGFARLVPLRGRPAERA